MYYIEQRINSNTLGTVYKRVYNSYDPNQIKDYFKKMVIDGTSPKELKIIKEFELEFKCAVIIGDLEE